MTENKNINFLNYIQESFPYIKGENIILHYCGEVNHEIIKALLHTLESYFFKSQLPRIIQKKTFNIMVECIQNIEKHTIKYLNNQENYYKKGSILISNFNDSIQIFSSNIVNDAQKSILLNKELQIKGKTKEQLRQMYKEQLIRGTISEKGGAGLGFIDIARKTNNNLYFHFYPISDDFIIFTLQVIIKK